MNLNHHRSLVLLVHSEKSFLLFHFMKIKILFFTILLLTGCAGIEMTTRDVYEWMPQTQEARMLNVSTTREHCRKMVAAQCKADTESACKSKSFAFFRNPSTGTPLPKWQIDDICSLNQDQLTSECAEQPNYGRIDSCMADSGFKFEKVSRTSFHMKGLN